MDYGLFKYMELYTEGSVFLSAYGVCTSSLSTSKNFLPSALIINFLHV